MSNDWFEKGELPPVGIECEYKLGHFWKHCKVKGDAFDYGHRIVLVQIGEGCKTTGESKWFRPIKSEREKAIEAALEFTKDTVFVEHSVKKLATIWYDAGMLRLPEDK